MRVRTCLPGRYRRLILGGLLCLLASKALSQDTHPACLDLALHATVIDDFVLDPLPISPSSACLSTATVPSTFDHSGFISYERPPDRSGQPGGFVGYQRIDSENRSVLYILQIHAGQNAVETVLLTGHEAQKATTSFLVDGRLHGIENQCQGLLWAEADTDGRLRMALNLSGLDVLYALVAPRGQPPRPERDHRTLNRLLNDRELRRVTDTGNACLGIAEYLLDPTSLEWRMATLIMQLEQENDHETFKVLTQLVPALDANGIAMLLEEQLDQVRLALTRGLVPEIVKPTDDAPLDAGYLKFHKNLQKAVGTRNIEALIHLTSPDVMLGFGGSGGHDDLRALLEQSDPDNGLWLELERLVALGNVRTGPDNYCAPYPGCMTLDTSPVFNDVFSTLVVVQANAPLFERPTDSSRVLKTLQHEKVMRVNSAIGSESDFERVQTHDGDVGYIRRAAVYSPVGLRIEVRRTHDGWKIDSLVAGD